MQHLTKKYAPRHSVFLGSRWALAVWLLALLVVLLWWLMRAIPFSLGSQVESGTSVEHPLPCISYSPFRRSEGRQDLNPFNYQASVTPAQIEEDLRILKTRTNCIRTYGLSQGLDGVPAIVRKMGMRMRLGVWLARDEAHNRRELERGLVLAEQFKDVVDMLVVGNEVLLRRELSTEGLSKILVEARKRSPVPVTYADVWEFWLRHAGLAQHVDVVTVHILPYWEDDPVAVKDAAQHVFSTVAVVQQKFAGKPIWVGETGWPAAGRQRAGAVPGRVEQSRFMTELLGRSSAQSSSWTYSVIEGFDQSWKRSFEGAMGGYWGLFDENGKPRVQFGGQVVEDVLWWRGPLGAVLGALSAALLMLMLRKIGRGKNVPLVNAAVAGALLGSLAPLQWMMMQLWDRSPREFAVSGALALLGLVASVMSLSLPSTKFQSLVRTTMLFAGATAALVLLLDARYRPFPWWWFMAPTAAFIAQSMQSNASQNVSQPQKLLACIQIACAVLVMFSEGVLNQQALLYGILLLLLAGAVVWPSRTKTSSPRIAAGAQSSVV